MLGNAPRHVAQFFANAWRVHIENDAGMLVGSVRCGDECWHPAVLGCDDDFVFDHPHASHAAREPAYIVAPLARRRNSAAYCAGITGGLPDGRTDIDRVLSEASDAGRVPGVVALAAGPWHVLPGRVRQARLADGVPMTMDTVFRIASMTKAVTGVAAMQCVEQGKLALDQPAGEIMPELAELQVLDGFDAAGKPILRPARRKVTLRHLLTHTAGFVYHVGMRS